MAQMSERYFVGIDVGSSATKGLILDDKQNVVAKTLVSSGMSFEDAARATLENLTGEHGIDNTQLKAIFATGYGRKNVDFATDTRTEISCHARGAYQHFPEEITVVDIGGQDNKIIQLSKTGQRRGFKMNRKCAAGTGAFLEEIARRIELPIHELEPLAEQSTVQVELGSFCTVFSITEVLTLIRKGVAVPDIVRAAFSAVVKRVVEMDSLSGKVVVTGGVVAHNPIILEQLTAATGQPVFAAPSAQFTGALGAALLASEQHSSI